ncbi:PREDICTED: integrator complex subunit 8-like [Galeopterus variegatus]|uniref:Integrator complex subunit 8-like n=1 Tax=Galeopterus variegatus TaxID=482537 RepID=A0ABM0S264_GALVR|nr:PREDICTED: integrator complex subunit 8-like [Galeopterus variegatus]
MVNGEAESSTAGLKIKTDEMQCQIGSLSLHCTIDEKWSAGYCQACDILVPSSDSTSQQLTPYSQVHICLGSGSYQFRQSVLRELFQKAQQRKK